MKTPSSLRRHVLPFSIATAGLLALSGSALGASPTPATASEAGSACRTSEPGIVGVYDHPTESTAVVLRMFVGGGFVPNEIRFMENPTFTLYGNNVAIFRPSRTSDSIADPLEPFVCSTLTPEQVDSLLAFALVEGGLADAGDLYANPNIVDTPNTVFTIDTDGTPKTVVIEALGFDQAPDIEARAQFQTLADYLDSFELQVEAGNAGPSQPFDVPLYNAMLTPAWEGLEDDVLPWPWADIAPALSDEYMGQVLLLTPEQVAQVATVPSGGQSFVVLEAPDGEHLNLTVSPILPGGLPAVA